MHYVYILRYADGSSYTGCTQDLGERFRRHANGHVPAAKNLLPVELIFYCAFKNKYKAFEFEKYLKSGSVGAFMRKRATINKNLELINYKAMQVFDELKFSGDPFTIE